MCLIYIGFHCVCANPECGQAFFEVNYRTHARKLHQEGRPVSSRDGHIEPCHCTDKLYIACISQYEKKTPGDYRICCYRCRRQNYQARDADLILPSEEAQHHQIGSIRRLNVERAATYFVEKLLNEMTDRQKSAARYHDDHEKIFVDTQHIMNERLHRKCDTIEINMVKALQARNQVWLDDLRQQMSEKLADLDPTVLPEIVDRLKALDEESRTKEAKVRSRDEASTVSGVSELSSDAKYDDVGEGESSVYDR